MYAIFNDQNFNDTLTNNIVSFEQLGPGLHYLHRPVCKGGIFNVTGNPGNFFSLHCKSIYCIVGYSLEVPLFLLRNKKKEKRLRIVIKYCSLISEELLQGFNDHLFWKGAVTILIELPPLNVYPFPLRNFFCLIHLLFHKVISLPEQRSQRDFVLPTASVLPSTSESTNVWVFTKIFKTLFPNIITDLIHLLYDSTYWSKILCSIIPTTLGHVQVKVTDLEF